MSGRMRIVYDEDRQLLLRLALGEDGWQETHESRFVHKETGDTTAVFDARVHGSIHDWRIEHRRVIATDWDPQ